MSPEAPLKTENIARDIPPTARRVGRQEEGGLEGGGRSRRGKGAGCGGEGGGPDPARPALRRRPEPQGQGCRVWWRRGRA